MADFCHQCSLQHFGKDFRDLADLGSLPSQNHGWPVICEGCGPTLVDVEGRCIAVDCLGHKIVK